MSGGSRGNEFFFPQHGVMRVKITSFCMYLFGITKVSSIGLISGTENQPSENVKKST